MSAAFANLGPATEALLARLFDGRMLAPAGDVAHAIGLDEKTLRALAEAGAVRSVLIGANQRRYTEADLRAFLTGETRMPPAKKDKPPSTRRRPGQVVPFSQRRSGR